MKRFLQWTGLLLLALLVLVGLLLAFHRPLLRGAARAWIVDNAPVPAVDALIVPGGGLETRPFGAAERFHAGKSDRIVIFEVEPAPTEKLEVIPPEDVATKAILARLDVPASAIARIGDEVDSTWDEVEATRSWCKANDIDSIAVLTEIFPSRRVRWAYRKGLADADIDLHVIALTPERYDSDTWWREERGLIAFQNEVIKFAYYLLKY